MRRPSNPTTIADTRPWLRLEEAAERLGTTPRSLRKRLYRADLRVAEGVVEAELDGNTYRKLGGRWRVRLAGGWS